MGKAEMNRFWRNTRTEKHRPDDPLDTGTPTPAPTPAGRRFKCVACDCVMTADGQDIWHAGDRYKTFLKHGDIVDAKDKEIARLGVEITDLKAKLQAAQGSGSGSASGHRPGHRIQ